MHVRLFLLLLLCTLGIALNSCLSSETTTPDTILPQTQLPTLKIGGKENPDVYLQSLGINIEVTGNIAYTRYTMVFKNKTNRILEGELTFPLPDERSVTHYALDIDGRMRDAVPVEKARATQVFEDIQQRRVDPGLLERVEGNNFRTRIYPIPSGGTRTISIGYEEDLTLENGLLYYRLPMAYADSIEKFSIKTTIFKGVQKPFVPKSNYEISFDTKGENYVASFTRKNYRPSNALIFALPAPADIPQVMMQPAQGSNYFFATVAPKMRTQKKQWDSDLAIIWDVSLSGSQRNLEQEMEILDIIFSEKKDANVNLYFLNNKLNSKGRYQITDGNLSTLKNVLKTAVFDGGTDFSKINLNEIAGNEILFFSDGISTLSYSDFLKDTNSIRPIHSIVSSAKSDYSAMKLIAGKTKGKFININALSPEKLKDELLNETLQFLGSEHEKEVREVYPSIATPVHGSFSIAGISDADNSEITLLFGFGNKVETRIKVQLDSEKAASQGNVYKIWAQKKINELDLSHENNRAELTELGQQFGIVTRNTSLIVLETINDYIRYGIVPPATEPQLLAEYQHLTMGLEWKGQKLGETQRRRGNLIINGVASDISFLDGSMRDRQFANDIDRVLRNVISLQTSGKTELGDRRSAAPGGFNDAYAEGGSGGIGDMFGGLMDGGSDGASSSIKAISEKDIDIGDGAGSRSKREIAQVVNARMSGLRYIYNKYLKEKPGFSGKVTLKLTIAPGGDIISISIISSTTDYEDFDNAIKDQVATWKWKATRGGTTTSTIPFNFSEDVSSYTEPIEPSQITQSSQSSESSSSQSSESSQSSQSTKPIRPKKPEPRRPTVVEIKKDSYKFIEIAVQSAKDLKRWWNKDFKHQTTKSKYPIPDEKVEVSNINFEKANNDYFSKLTGKTIEDYQTYLQLRNDYSNVPAFYFDMSNWFYAHDDKETALRILTSIADLELENASLYRLLGYKFKEYGEYNLEKFVCQKVVEWRPMDPQSYRDYALALADNGEEQAALDSLYSLLTRSYSINIGRRNQGIEEVVVMEINNLIAKNPNLNTSKIDKRLIVKTPVDIRIVINWNMDNTNVNLHVIDPNDEESSSRWYRETKIGGRMSADMRDGYGPKQFLLKKAVNGKYKVYVSYYGGSQFTSAEHLTVMAEIFTKYSDKTEKCQIVSLQMSNAKDKKDKKVEVAEISF